LSRKRCDQCGKPFGAEGLKNWLAARRNSTWTKYGHTIAVGSGRANGVFNWGPYAELRHLKRPVDLIMLQTHPRDTNPTQPPGLETATWIGSFLVEG